jgi:phosphate transport system substrate-binding protein
MTMRRGRCMNVELCSMATSQKIVEIPEDEPFICPRCSSDLVVVVKRKGSAALRAVQIGAVIIGVAGIGAKVYLDNQPKPAPAASPGAPASAAAGVTASTAAPSAPPAPAPVTVTPFLRLTASDVAADRLAQRLAAGYLALSGDADIHTQPGSATGVTDVVGLVGGEAEAISVARGGAQDGVAAVGSGAADLAVLLRPEGAAVAQNTSADAYHVLGQTSYAVVVNSSAPVASLTFAQVQSVFSGKTKNWSELGGAAADVAAYVPAGGVAGGLFGDASEPAGLKVEANDKGVLSAVAGDAGGIGLVSVAAAAHAHVLPVSDAAAHSLTLQATLYGAADGGAGEAAGRFAAYAASAGAQLALGAAGFAPAVHAAPASPVVAAATPAAAAPVVAAAAPAAPATPPAPVLPERFKRFIAGASPLPFVIHFEQASSQLDRAGSRDVEKLATYLKDHDISGDNVLLAGFSDNTGSPGTKEAAAQRRVAAVAAALTRQGIVPAKTAGFGADVPVADDATSDGRDKNRRVEVYVTK